MLSRERDSFFDEFLADAVLVGGDSVDGVTESLCANDVAMQTQMESAVPVCLILIGMNS